MIQKFALSLALMTIGLSASLSTAHAKVPAVAAPIWSCTLDADVLSTSGFGLPFFQLSRTWSGQGVATCLTPEGSFSRNIALTITKVGPALGIDQVQTMHLFVPQAGIKNWSQLFTDFQVGPSVDGTAIAVHGEIGLGLTLTSAGGVTLTGALGGGQAVGLELGVSIAGSAQINDLGPAN